MFFASPVELGGRACKAELARCDVGLGARSSARSASTRAVAAMVVPAATATAPMNRLAGAVGPDGQLRVRRSSRQALVRYADGAVAAMILDIHHSPDAGDHEPEAARFISEDLQRGVLAAAKPSLAGSGSHIDHSANSVSPSVRRARRALVRRGSAQLPPVPRRRSGTTFARSSSSSPGAVLRHLAVALPFLLEFHPSQRYHTQAYLMMFVFFRHDYSAAAHGGTGRPGVPADLQDLSAMDQERRAVGGEDRPRHRRQARGRRRDDAPPPGSALLGTHRHLGLRRPWERPTVGTNTRPPA